MSILTKIKSLKQSIDLLLPFFRYLRPHSRRLGAVMVLSLLAMGISLVMPLLSRLVVDNVILTKDYQAFLKIWVVGIVCFLVNNAISTPRGWMELSLRLKVTFDLRREVLRRLERLSLSRFQDKSSSQYLFMLNADVDNVLGLITSFFLDFFTVLAHLLFVFLMVCWLDWQMGALVSVIAAIFCLWTEMSNRRLRRMEEVFLGTSQNIFVGMGELLQHMYLVKALRKERSELNKYVKLLISNLRAQVTRWKQTTLYKVLGTVLLGLSMGVIIFFGIYQVTTGGVTPGVLTAVMIYLGQMNHSANRLAQLLRRINSGSIHCRRLHDLLYAEVEPPANGAVRLSMADEPRLELRGVTFGYGSSPVVSNMSFAARKGLYALAGPSGCGKTTLLNLIMNLYDPWKGSVLINGANVRDVERLSFRRFANVALQDPFLWNDSVANNVRYCRPGAGMDEIAGLASVLGMESLIASLPEGYNTVLGENACRLSEGQKQKIAVMRALITRPRLLILDEAMSSMDSASEDRILRGIRELLPNSIVLVVSHRLSTIMACDRVLFARGPSEIIDDTARHLIAHDKQFHALFASQLIKSQAAPVLEH